MKRIFVIGLLISSFYGFSQTPVATAPFELFGDHIFIQLSVDGSEPLDFIFDSGAGITVIDVEAAKQLKLDLSHKGTAAGAQGTIAGSKIKHNKIQMGDIKLESDITIEAFNLNHLSISIGRKIEGIIGYDLLAHHAARLNYTDGLLEVYSPDQFPKTGKKVAFKLHNSIPVIEASVTLANDQRLSGTFYVNTGAGTSLDFNTPFAAENKLLSKTGNHYSYLVKGVEDKETKHSEGRINSLDLNFYEFKNIPVGISQGNHGLQADKKISGILGNKVLSRFNIVFDYKNAVFYFEPNASVSNPFYVNCSGLDVQMSADMSKVMIHQVQPEGPAKLAGINAEDELIGINGKAVSDLTLVEIENLLKVPGTTVKLEVKTKSGVEKIDLKLENLL